MLRFELNILFYNFCLHNVSCEDSTWLNFVFKKQKFSTPKRSILSPTSPGFSPISDGEPITATKKLKLEGARSVPVATVTAAKQKPLLFQKPSSSTHSSQMTTDGSRNPIPSSSNTLNVSLNINFSIVLLNWLSITGAEQRSTNYWFRQQWWVCGTTQSIPSSEQPGKFYFPYKGNLLLGLTIWSRKSMQFTFLC